MANKWFPKNQRRKMTYGAGESKTVPVLDFVFWGRKTESIL